MTPTVTFQDSCEHIVWIIASYHKVVFCKCELYIYTYMYIYKHTCLFFRFIDCDPWSVVSTSLVCVPDSVTSLKIQHKEHIYM